MSLASPWPRVALLPAATLFLAGCSLFTQSKEAVGLVAEGDSRDLRDSEEPRTALTERRPDILILAIDGVDRDLLYAMLRRGELPGMSRFLGRRSGDTFAHAHLDERVLSGLPTSTAPAWASLYTAAPPSVHGVVGNEFFIREKKELAAPVPVSFLDTTPSLRSYTEDYADGLLEAPTIYQRIRARDPGVRIWVAMCMYHRGADRLLMARRTAVAAAFKLFVEKTLVGEDDEIRMEKFAALDREVLTVTGNEVAGVDRDEPLPDILTVYIAGVDGFGHKSSAGADPARRAYLKKAVDPELARLHQKLLRRGALDDRFVVIVSDHGQATTEADDRTALGDDEGDEAPAILAAAGFRVRARKWEVPEGSDYDAVFAYGGPTAYLYLADRSTCEKDGTVCDFTRPPRFQEDVVPAADALLRATSKRGKRPGMRGTIDLVLARRPRAIGDDDVPFQVYLGGGKMEDVGRYLERHPHPEYPHFERRLRELATGAHGERAGDIMLISKFVARDPSRRYYFGHELRSQHGGPSRKESEVPFVLAHPRMTRAELARIADRAFGGAPTLSDVGELLIDLRLDDRRTARARRRH